MKYRILKKGDRHALQVKKWYGWANFYYSTGSIVIAFGSPLWYYMTADELLQRFKGTHKIEVVMEGRV